MGCILVTGANGMIGSHVVKELLYAGYDVLGLGTTESSLEHENYSFEKIDLTQCLEVEKFFDRYDVSRVIHLAAIAHRRKGMNLSWSRYYRINTLCSKTIFECAAEKKIPVFFASTVDVYGITEGPVTPETERYPIGEYARSKYLAENALREICRDSPHTIARFTPVYTEDNKWDRNKRFYLKEPGLAFRIGKGVKYSFLNVDKVASFIAAWIGDEKANGMQQEIILFDDEPCDTAKCITAEKLAGRAEHVIVIPMWMMKLMSWGVGIVFGKQSYKAFMMAKLIDPIDIVKG